MTLLFSGEFSGPEFNRKTRRPFSDSGALKGAPEIGKQNGDAFTPEMGPEKGGKKI